MKFDPKNNQDDALDLMMLQDLLKEERHEADLGRVRLERDPEGRVSGVYLGCSCGEFEYLTSAETGHAIADHRAEALAKTILESEVSNQIKSRIWKDSGIEHADWYSCIPGLNGPSSPPSNPYGDY